MRHARRHHQLKWVTDISVTPLLDLVFILLFAFMVALPLVSQKDSLLTSPSTNSTTPSPAPQDTITLTLLPSNAISWDGADFTVAQLEARMLETLRTRPTLGVILEMPPDLPVSLLVSPMNALRNAGVQSTAIRLTTLAAQ